MRINIVLPILSRRPIGGVRVVLEYADFLARRGHKVTIIHAHRESRSSPSLRLRLVDWAWSAKTRALNHPLIPWHVSQRGVRHLLVGSLAKLRVPPADATVATAWQTAEVVADLPEAAGQKFYFIQHYETWSGNKSEVDATWRLPLRKIVIAKWLIEIGRSLGVDDCLYVSNGINFDRFKAIRPIEGRSMQVVTLNHSESSKGVKDVLAALRVFHRARPDVPVLMFGAHAPGPEIPAWIRYYENPDQSVLVSEIYNECSVYVGGSTEEGWGLPAAEAMACGCTFVGTDIGGFREFARDKINALLTEPNNPRELARSLLALDDDPDFRCRLQIQAHEDISAFTMERAGLAFERALLSGQVGPIKQYGSTVP